MPFSTIWQNCDHALKQQHCPSTSQCSKFVIAMLIKFLIARFAYKPILLAAIGIGGASLFHMPCQAQNEATVVAQDLPAISNTTLPRSDFSRYTEPGIYTIDYPRSWLISKPAASVTTIQNRQPSEGGVTYPPNFINTEIYFRPERLEAALQHLLRTNDARYQPGTLTRRGELTVGGKEAVRLWFEGGRFGEDRILTLIRYSETQTAVISSYFTTGETAGISTIQDMHWSFRAD